jgi:DNA-binding SARP family transcriptional activator/Tfp pilus assembly protein PilF
MTGWQLDLLGGFALRPPEGAAVAFSTRKDRLLLAYLALQGGRPQSRAHLGDLLWADRADAQARGSLRQSLVNLRGILGDQILQSNRETVTVDASLLTTDALLFLQRAKVADAGAVSLYVGELLQGFDAPTAAFEQWLRAQRQHLDDVATKFVVEFANRHSGDIAASAIMLARQLLGRDRLNEPLHRALIQLLLHAGDRTGALKAYTDCRAALASELDVTPELETEQLYRDILTGQSPLKVQPVHTRPSLAVLPFANPGNDVGLAPLCEGLAEEITAGLARFRLFFVIDQHSAAEVARLTMDSEHVGKRLGVEFLVQGSITRRPTRLRIAASLIRAATRELLWSNSYDVSDTNAPEVPEQIASALINTLHGRVESALIDEARRKPSLAAYECLLRGIRHLRGYDPEDNTTARDLFQKALDLDPEYTLARAYLAFSEIVLQGYELAPRQLLENAKNVLVQAVEHDPEDYRIHWLLGLACWSLGEESSPMRHYARAIELNPGDANVKAACGFFLGAEEKYEQGIATIAEAMRLNPYHPQWYWDELGNLLGAAGRYEEAIEALSRSARPRPWHLARLASVYALVGKQEKARETIAKLLMVLPDASISKLSRSGLNERDQLKFAEGLRRAGLRE